MEFLQSAIQNPFVWGLLLGLLIAGFIWKSGFTARRHALAEVKRLQAEMKDLQGHLNTQLKINADGNKSIQAELESLRQQNENLRVNLAALQQKPGKAEMRQLQMFETALRTMREQAPGFAPAWEKALRQAETEMEAADKGLLKLVRRVIPGLGSQMSGSSAPALSVSQDAE
ncbi:MAG: hypothetical protein J0M04_22755 [Verrucomicrobia bacterium]|nr:hypothetical protein [Verrucomicrobiota bacterium]